MEFDELLDGYGNGHNLFLDGEAGTGKTYTINALVSLLRLNGQINYAIVAATGTAASNIGGCTIHSYFGIGVTVLANTAEKDIRDKIMKSKYFNNGLKLLIIDEISMVGSQMLAVIDGILRRNHSVNKPFGGVQVIVSGDFYQLPPVKDNYCFQTLIWQSLNLKRIEFKEQKRYTCEKTFSLLSRLRMNKLNDEDKVWLDSRVDAYNNKEYENLLVPPVILYTRNASVDAINSGKLDELPGRLYTFKATDEFKSKKVGFQLFPDVKKKYLDELAEEYCNLKINAPILIYRNYSVPERLTNGRLGKVLEIDQDSQTVRIMLSDGTIHLLGRKQFTIEGPGWTLSRTQIVIKATWAITNYKAQGMTLDSAIINVADCFANGQVYTTIARVINIDNLYIEAINYDKIKVLDHVF